MGSAAAVRTTVVMRQRRGDSAQQIRCQAEKSDPANGEAERRHDQSRAGTQLLKSLQEPKGFCNLFAQFRHAAPVVIMSRLFWSHFSAHTTVFCRPHGRSFSASGRRLDQGRHSSSAASMPSFASASTSLASCDPTKAAGPRPKDGRSPPTAPPDLPFRIGTYAINLRGRRPRLKRHGAAPGSLTPCPRDSSSR